MAKNEQTHKNVNETTHKNQKENTVLRFDELKHKNVEASTTGFAVLPLPVRLTIRDVEKREKVTYAIASGFVNLLVKRGLAKPVGKRIQGKGKGQTIYELLPDVSLNLAA